MGVTGEPTEHETESTTRRGFLRAAAVGAAAVGASAGATRGASAQDEQEPAQTFRFGGEVAAWQGEEPSDIEGAENPTLELEAGTQYEVVWENLDGQPHDFVLQDDGGGNLAGTEQMSEQGATRSVTFEATPEMTTYICTVHPTTMVGDVEVSGGTVAEPEDTGISTWSLLMVGAVVAMFLSPVVFALFLFSRGREAATER
ncbi:plastocyanin/azurin family copper-binding protein [Halorussus salilacus]|uniref:cupredoxin domain-containing protein n=1 Tax=Halorussus salilacus TaxID=2953750 RepID=UPI0020A0896C|nr:plastocyanin/azurin family copper-binding protein [Halorussus salilacus]USZ68395.1 plastocyanin/azurin family copper-binding protein [Halorussus salilacus]